MTIQIVRNEAGNCVNFVGTSNPAYWNACLSAEVDSEDPTRINILNNIRTSDPAEPVYEFYKIPFTDFVDKDGNAFADATATAEYITANASVIGASTDGVGSDLSGETVCFSLDDTSTSILLDIGYSYGVNTIKAVPDADGTVHIKAKLGDRTLFSQLAVGSACKADGSIIPGGLNDVVNYLNELFTVGPFEAVVISDPFSTMIADVAGVDAGYSLVGSTAVDPLGNDVFGNTGSGNYAGLKTTATIDQAGEYYTFDIRGEGTIGFGLVHTDASFAAGKFSGNSNYADPSGFAVGNSAHFGYQFSHWFHPTPNGSWTNYGANTAYSGGPGWSNNWDQQADWLAGNPVKIRCGIDANGYISIESLQDDNTWMVHARTGYPVPQGSEYHLGIKSSSSSARVFSAPKVHLLEPEAPVMNFRWIESPDGVFVYPLFTTAEEAEYYDEIHNGLAAGAGSSHTHTYVDDPTNTTWYMPEASHDPTSYHYTSAPSGSETFAGTQINWTTITSLNNADLAPPVFSAIAISQEEGTAVNIQVAPAGASWSTSVSISPTTSGLVWDGYSMVQGTLADVGSDTTYTITVTRGNSYGSTTGTMTVTATNVAPVQTNITPWTKALDFSGSSERAQMVSDSTVYNPMMMAGSSVTRSAPSNGQTTSSGHPWATSCVFKIDGNGSNQHIWNCGEGAGATDDNIYLRVDSGGALFFGWGRDGALNEYLIATNLGSASWYGAYIAHNGARFSGADATPANLESAFNIQLMYYSSSNGGGWINNPNTPPGTRVWSTSGGRMDRSVTGSLTIGGRGTNRSFHGKIASFVTTTLKNNDSMPSTAEQQEMVTDPLGWLATYKEGNTFRRSYFTNETNWDTANLSTKASGTQIFLMGDGTNDSYSNMIRNQVAPTDQNYTKLNLISMVSNDIQNVTIPGLT